MKPYVRKIRPEDEGYGTNEAEVWPWLVFNCYPWDPHRAQAFPTYRQALYFAVTGKRLRLSFEERLDLRSRPSYQRWCAGGDARREARRAASKAR